MSPKVRKIPSEPKIIPIIPKTPRIPEDYKQKVKQEKLNEYIAREKEAIAEGISIEPFVEEVEEEEDFTGCEDHDLLLRNTMSFRCLAQVALSSSSVLRSVEYNFPPVEDPGLDAALNFVEPTAEADDMGLNIYLELSKNKKIMPLRRIVNSLDLPEMNLKFYGLREDHMECLMEALKTNEYIVSLVLQENYLTPSMAQMLGEMLAENNEITIVNMKSCNLGPLGAAKLKKHLPYARDVIELDLSCNNLGDSGMKHLEKMVGMTNLTKLNLSNNNLTPDCAESLEVILGNKQIKHLDLSWNSLGSDECYDILFNAIVQNDSLQVLNLSNNGFCTNPAVFMVFTAYLPLTTQLQELDFSWNRMPAGKFIRELRKGVIQNRSLEILRVAFNPWTPEQAYPLSQVIALNPNLKVLDMENIWFTKKVKRIIANAKLNNKTFIYGGIYQDWEIKGPNMTVLVLKRIRAIFLAPKRVSKKQEFGNLLLNLPEGPMKKIEFEDFQLRRKYKKLVDDFDLCDALYAIYTKDRRLDTLQMQKDYLELFGNDMDSIVKKKKKKRKKGGSSSRVSIKTSLSTAAGSKSSFKKSSSKGSKTSHVSVTSGTESAKELEEVRNSKGEIIGSKIKIGSRVSIKDSKGSKEDTMVAIQEEGVEELIDGEPTKAESIPELPPEEGQENQI